MGEEIQRHGRRASDDEPGHEHGRRAKAGGQVPRAAQHESGGHDRREGQVVMSEPPGHPECQSGPEICPSIAGSSEDHLGAHHRE